MSHGNPALEVYATDSNYAIIKPPGRNFPGCVIQGDSLNNLCGMALNVAQWFRDNGPSNDEELLDNVQELAELLVGRLLHYQQVLKLLGIALPYSRPISETDMVCVLPPDES